jgi:hypothetical protein
VKKSTNPGKLKADLTGYLTEVVKNDPAAPIPPGMKASKKLNGHAA